MCGIVGVLSPFNETLHQLITQASPVQFHRGPDAQGVMQHNFEEMSVAFGHQRLSILDLSSSGDQPMVFQNHKGMIVYNGEVYNYREIKNELLEYGYHFNSSTDTEVILTALHHWGIEGATSRFNGMWAFAWLDIEHQKLVLSRDRAGVKPLYYFYNEGSLFFSSELKTILQMSKRKFRLNYQAIGEYLVQSLLNTSEQSFFEEIHQIPAAHNATVDLDAPGELYMQMYWSVPENSNENYPATQLPVLIEEVRELFFDSVRLRLRSDVPVGVLLSGGVDSSAIATAMNQILGNQSKLNILSAVSDHSKFDESPFIDIMGRFLDKPVTKVNLAFKAEEAIQYLEQVCWFNDAPVGSFSNVAHFLLMREAKASGITVIMSGQGADELLCGYKKYLGFYVQHLVRKGSYGQALLTMNEFYKRGSVINQFNWSEAKRYLPRYLQSKELDIRGEVLLQNYAPVSVGLGKGETVQDRQRLDFTRFSVPVLTHYEDRMSMAWSREIRVPFLDYRLVSKLIPLAPHVKLRDGWTKWIFRKAMEPYLPKEIVWRKDKQGFVNPQSEWLKYDLKEQLLNYFKDEQSLMYKFGLVNQTNLLAKYDAYCKQSEGKGKIWFKDVFNPLALEIWLRKFESYIM